MHLRCYEMMHSACDSDPNAGGTQCCCCTRLEDSHISEIGADEPGAPAKHMQVAPRLSTASNRRTDTVSIEHQRSIDDDVQHMYRPVSHAHGYRFDPYVHVYTDTSTSMLVPGC